MSRQWNIAVAGAAGTVGGQIVECLVERRFPAGRIKFLAGDRSAGEVLEFRGKPVAVEEMTRDSFTGIDIALFSVGSSRSAEFCPLAVSAGAVCIDNSGAWRMDPDVPLVVSDVNPQEIAGYTGKGIIACPNSSTIQLSTVLKPLHEAGRIKRVVVSTYQSVSGTGKKAIEELRVQTIDLMSGRPARHKVYPHRIAFNCLPQTDLFGPNGYTREEMQLASEAGKILAADFRITTTTVRVPVFYGNCASVNIETEKKVTAAEARDLLGSAPGCKLLDNVADGVYPLPSDAAGQDLTYVGRIREDESIGNGLNLWLAADNIRNMAVNTVRIAEELIGKYLK